MTQVSIRRTLNGYGWHTVAGGRNGSSPWHQDGDKPCPYLKPEAKTVQDAVRFLEAVLSPGGVLEAEILTQADQQGLTDALLAKARKRLGVKVQDGIWALPGPEPEPEATEPDKGGRPRTENPMSPAERKRGERARKRQPGPVAA